MSESAEKDTSPDAWYSLNGPENDVVVSSRIRLGRNLANFVFPGRLRPEDAERVQILVFDAFTHVENPEQFQALRFSALDQLGQRILTERGVFAQDMYSLPFAGGIIRSDGKIACSVNVTDHVRLSAFSPGLCLGETFDLCKNVDEQLQDSLQFAASVDDGYLTASLNDVGSGMKCSVMLHLPAVSHGGSARKYFQELEKNGCHVRNCFGSGTDAGSPLGAYYLLFNATAHAGSETDQFSRVENTARNLALAERGLTIDFVHNRSTKLKDLVYRAVATIKYSRLIDTREGIDLLSKIKWGISSGIVAGVSHSVLGALLYRVQNGHLSYILRNSRFNFEKDILSEDVKIERLRALVIQEALAGVEIVA